MCRSTLLQCRQVKVRKSRHIKSWPIWLGSIAVSFMGEPQAVHWRTLVLRVEHCFAASVRCPEFNIKPAGRLRLKGIRCNDADLDVIAFGAFEQPVFETNWTRCNALQHHPRLAVGTARALNRGHELCGRGHDTSLHLAGALAGRWVTGET
jgi:hypothetical protein